MGEGLRTPTTLRLRQWRKGTNSGRFRPSCGHRRLVGNRNRLGEISREGTGGGRQSELHRLRLMGFGTLGLEVRQTSRRDPSYAVAGRERSRQAHTAMIQVITRNSSDTRPNPGSDGTEQASAVPAESDGRAR